MTEEILKQIKQLPPLPESAMQIEAVYQDPNSNFSDMVKILEKDPLLTADILKAANSPLYGFSREINAISQAVGLFGMGTIRGFALASIVKKSFALNFAPYGITADMFSTLSKKQHALATAWCFKKEMKLLDVLSPAAFLVEIGKTIIAQQIIALKAEQRFKDELIASGDVEKSEKALIGVSTTEVSSMIFEHWKFEKYLVNTIKYCKEPENAPEEVQKAAKILGVVRACVQLNGVITDETIAKAKELITKYELDMQGFEQALESVNQES